MPVTKRDVKNVIENIIRDKHHFPSSVEMADALFLPMAHVHKCMRALEEDGYLAKAGNWYRLAYNENPAQETQNETLIAEEAIEEEQKEYSEEQPIDEIKEIKEDQKPIVQEDVPTEEISYGAPIYILRYAMSIIGIGAIVISIYYTTIWLIEFLPFLFALLLSSIMILFSVSAFEVIILFAAKRITRHKFSKLSIIGSFTLLWLVVVTFSILSTVAGQYNKHVNNLRENSIKGVGQAQFELYSIKERKQEIQDRIKEQTEQIKSFRAILNGISTIEERERNNKIWMETQWRLGEATKQITKLSDELNKIRDMERTIVEKNKDKGILLTKDFEQLPDFYGWMSNVTGIVRDKVQFWMSLFPAIFVDIIAPVALAIALFLKQKEATNEKRF